MTADPTVLVCVGATKSGTSWLYRHLRAHPECHFRAIKELHYFDMSKPAHFQAAAARLTAQLAEVEARCRTASLGDLPGLEMKRADLAAWRDVVARGKIDLAAYRAFLLGGRDGQVVVGDVTPAYAMLPVPRLARIAELPGVKALFLMRDPLARTWSHIRMVAARTGAAFEATARGLLARMTQGDLSGEGRGIAERGDYAGIIPRLKAVFPASALHLDFYEDLLSPSGLQRLWSFLGIGPGPVALEDKVFESPKLNMTGDEQRALRRWLAPQYDFVSGLMPNLPQAWRANMEEGLA